MNKISHSFDLSFHKNGWCKKTLKGISMLVLKCKVEGKQFLKGKEDIIKKL